MKWFIVLWSTLLLIINVHAEAVKIQISRDAIPAERTAAKELQAGLKKIFSIDFPIVKGDVSAPAVPEDFLPLMR